MRNGQREELNGKYRSPDGMNLHNLAIDNKGNVSTAEVQGTRMQRFRNLSGL